MIKKRQGADRKDIVSSLVRAHPDAPNRTLARLLHEQYPHEFPNINSAACAVRYRVGQQGKLSRKGATVPRPAGSQSATPTLPAGLRQERPPLKLTEPGEWLLISDLHAPYHNEVAIEAAVKHAVDNGVKNIVINGDAVDFYRLSVWTQDPRMRNPDEEIKTLHSILDYLEKWFPGSRVFKAGNHEERYEHYLYQRAPALVGIEDFELHKILKLAERGWQWVHGRQRIEMGDLAVLHGHELPRGLTDPVNIGRGVWLRVRESAIVGHWHRTSTHLETAGIRKKVATCYSIGCLCDLTPDYATINNWNHGFAIVRVGERKTWNVSNRTIHEGTVYATE